MAPWARAWLFEVKNSGNYAQPYFWRVIATNGRELAKSETLTQKAHVVAMANKLKAQPYLHRYETFRSNYGTQPLSFRVWDGSRIVIASSETYHNEADAQKAATDIRDGASSATIVDNAR